MNEYESRNVQGGIPAEPGNKKEEGKMRMYLCELVLDGVVIERFYRRGESAQAVRKGLDMFRWPAGEWRVTKN